MMSKTLSFDQLLVNESFIKYALSNGTEEHIHWHDYLSTYPEEQNTVEAAKKEIIRIQNAWIYIEQQSTLEDIKSKISDSIPAEVSPIRSIRRVWWSVAAAIVVLCATTWLFYQQKSQISPPVEAWTTYTTPAGAIKDIILVDGTKVTLSVSSSLEIDSSFNQNNRTVILRGEAFFNVAHDREKPFIIQTKAMDIRVLGTIFNVKAYDNDDQAQTSLIEGKIEVTLKNKQQQKLTLLPSEKIIVQQLTNKSIATEQSATASTYQVSKVNSATSQADEMAWKENKLSFKKESLLQISSVLERWYDVSIVFEDELSKQLSYSGTFKSEETILEILKTFQSAESFTYRQEGNIIYIKTTKTY